MKLLIFIPVYNEASTIKSVIQTIPKSIDGISKIETLVINDGSTDETLNILKELKIRVISHHKNIGVGAAFQTGITEAIRLGADIAVNLDGDGQFSPEDISKLIFPIIEKTADFTTASRFIEKLLVPKMEKFKYVGNMLMSWFISLLTGNKFYDVSCGYRAYSSDVLLHLNLLGKFTYTQETILDLAFKGYRIKEIPIKVRGIREYGKSRVADNLLGYAYKSLKIIIRTFRDYKPLLFFTIMAGYFFVCGFGLEIFFFLHYYLKGNFSPHLWAGLSGGFLLGIGVIIFSTGLLADMFVRIRKNQEEILFLQKRMTFRD